jgi:hypothetical protein
MTNFDIVAERLDTSQPAPYDTLEGPEAFIATWMSGVEGAFGRAGFYGGVDVAPYADPTATVNDPLPKRRPSVNAVRRMWLARFNPNQGEFRHDDGRSGSDVATGFPWRHPENAHRDGWWLSTATRPTNRTAIMDIAVDDLVLVQRSDRNHDLAHDRIAARSLVGLAAVLGATSWTDVGTGERHRDVCLVPLAWFSDHVPVLTAQAHGRLKGLRSISRMPQLHGPSGQVGYTLSVVNWEDVPEVCAVCNLHPMVFTDPVPTVAARLAVTDTGNERMRKLRWDHVFRNDLRREQERRAIADARAWAAEHDLVFIEGQSDMQMVGGAGFDLRLYDADDLEVQIEVKGYRTHNLADVHLQPSQVARARDAAAGNPPPWFLHALLKAHTKSPQRRTLTAAEAVALLDAGLLDRDGKHLRA